MKSVKLFICSLLVFLALLGQPTRGSISPEAGQPRRYVGGLSLGDAREERCEFAIEVDKIAFVLNSLENKYRLIRVRVDNFSRTPILLSPDKDSFELKIGENIAVKGLLSLRKADPQLWDSLTIEMREALAYPQTFEPAKVSTEGGRETPQPIYLFVFFPKDKVPQLPGSFTYRIDSLDKTSEIRERVPAKR